MIFYIIRKGTDMEEMQAIRIALCENDEKDLEALKLIVGETITA